MTNDFSRFTPEALERLAASDTRTWDAFVSELPRSPSGPPELVRAMLAIDDTKGWLNRAYHAYSGRAPDDGMFAHFELQRWLRASIVATLPPTDPRSLEARLEIVLDDTGPDAATLAQALADDIERAGHTEPFRRLLGRAHLTIARRRGEYFDHEGAIAACRVAEQVFAALGDATWRTHAVRMRGAALVRQRKLDEAIALLATIESAPSTAGCREGALGPDRAVPDERTVDPIDTAFYAAADKLTWSTGSAEWLRDLENVPERGRVPDVVARLREHIDAASYRDTVRFPTDPTHLTDEIVELIATSGVFPALVELTICGPEVTDRGVRFLASNAAGLDRLESIHLDGKIDDATVEALARSRRLPALRRISRTVTHHVYSGGVRDDTEVTPIARPDGRIVESVISHVIWP